MLQVTTIAMACCILHNFLLDERDEGKGLQLYDRNGTPKTTSGDKIYHGEMQEAATAYTQRAGLSARTATLLTNSESEPQHN